MNAPRVIAFTIIAAVLIGWVVDGLWLYRLLSRPGLRDTYFVTATASAIAKNLGIALLPAGLAAFLASPANWRRRWIRIAVWTTLLGAGTMLFTVCFGAAFEILVVDARMPRRFGTDPAIATLTWIYLFRALGALVALVGGVIGMVALIAGGKAKA